MKEQPTNMGSDNLSKLLQEWRTDSALPPGFQAGVWRKIDSQAPRQAKGESLIQMAIAWLNQFVLRPQLAVAYVALVVMVGVTAGWTHGRREVTRVQDEMAQRYVQTLDPYQARTPVK